MNTFKYTATFFTLALLTACSTPKTPVTSGGSKADGLIVMSFESDLFEAPVVDWNTTKKTALKSCQAWGYRKTTAFGAIETRCVSRNGFGDCITNRTERTYQCHS